VCWGYGPAASRAACVRGQEQGAQRVTGVFLRHRDGCVGSQPSGQCVPAEPQLPESRDSGRHLASLPGGQEGLVKAHPLPVLRGSPESPKTNPEFFFFSPLSPGILSGAMIQQSKEAAVSEKEQAAPLLLAGS